MRLNKYITVLQMLFLNNGYWKLLALVIAILLYFTIRTEISHMRVISVPVEVENDRSVNDAAIWSVKPLSVQVRVRGSYTAVNEIDPTKLKCVVRARHKSSSILDTVSIKVRPNHIQGVRNARIVKIEPTSIDVKFDVPRSFTLAIAPPELKGTARGTVSLLYDVTNATVTGSERLLKDLDVTNTRIQCEPIDVEGRLDSFNTRLRLVPPGDVANVTVTPSDMVVNVIITSRNVTRTNQQFRVNILSRPESPVNRWLMEPEFVDIQVSGRAELLKGEQFLSTMAAVNGEIPFVPGQTNEVPVLVYARHGMVVDWVKAVPDKVKLIALPLSQPAAMEEVD
ncbi:MAG: hypothetical protein PHO37_16025 [Kiritimatiellae bacterium]|nr:hypothetical protein [Kiritimatiellia bacterium]